jgi:glutamate 5-kinase
MVSIQLIRKKSTQAKLITDVTEINHDLEKYIDKDLSEFGSGGMLAKVNAAKLCMQSGSTYDYCKWAG